MDWLDFVASLVRSLAWPVALVVVVWLLRKEIQGLLQRLEKLRHKDTEATFFARKVEEIAERVSEEVGLGSGRESPPDGDKGEPSDQEEDARSGSALTMLRDLVWAWDEYPESTVLKSWEALERVLRERARQQGLRVADGEAFPVLLSTMLQAGGVTRTQAELISDLSRLRNDVASEKTRADYESARRYRSLVGFLLKNCRRLPQWRHFSLHVQGILDEWTPSPPIGAPTQGQPAERPAEHRNTALTPLEHRQ